MRGERYDKWAGKKRTSGSLEDRAEPHGEGTMTEELWHCNACKWIGVLAERADEDDFSCPTCGSDDTIFVRLREAGKAEQCEQAAEGAAR